MSQSSMASLVAMTLVSSAGAIDLIDQNFNLNDGGFVEEATGATPIPAVYSAVSGSWTIEGDDSGPATNTITSPAITVTTTAGLQVSFDHRYSFEVGNWDGGGLQISIDGGAFKNVPVTSFSQNGYSNTAPLQGNHVLAGLDGFSAESVDYSLGTFITSVANVGGVRAGSTFEIRFVGAFDTTARGAGIPNWEIDSVKVETLLDSDSDGMPDVYEIAESLDSADASDANTDLDLDNVSNLDEYLQGTDPQDDDSDDDGAKDGVETNSGTYVDAADAGTDPLNPDTDGDGLLDGAENPDLPFVDRDQAGTSPILTDSDGDGFADGLEILASTSDPTDSDSRPLRAGLLDLLAYWDFNDNSDPTTTFDRVRGFQGDLKAGTVFSADATGRSLSAGDRAMDMGAVGDAGTGVIVENGRFLGLAGAQDQIGISFWVNTPALTNSTAFYANSPSIERAFGSNAPWSNGRVYWDTFGCCDQERQRSDVNGGIALNTWTHIVLNKNGDTKEIWVNGVRLLQKINTENLPETYTRFFIGTDSAVLNTVGLLDDMAVYADALNADEVARLFAGDDPLSLVPSNDDSDLDKMPDVYEIANGLDPAVDDSAGDPDGDELTNIMEYLGGTDPQDDDSDDDGLTDRVETNTGIWVSVDDRGTDPLNGDSDGDGLSDAVEDNGGSFVNAMQAGSNPNLVDTDGDGQTDGLEVEGGADPNDPESMAAVASFTTLTGLLGGDLTDPEDDGFESDTVFANNTNPQTAGTNFNWVSITASSEQYFHGFGGNEGAFDLFDNKIGPGEAKFCCGGVPFFVAVEFEAPVSLTHLTLTSSNDSPLRDPLDFQIQGSNDGVNFEVIFERSDDVSLWTARNQTVRIDLPSASDAFKFIRYDVTRSGGPNLALGEVEYFGEAGVISPPEVTSIDYDADTNRVTLVWNSRGGKTYTVFTSTDLNDFSEDVNDNVSSGGETTTFSFTLPQPIDKRRFYRIQLNE